jgi:hypothetical protein
MLGLALECAWPRRLHTCAAPRGAQDVGQGAHARLPEVEPAAGLAFTLKPFQKQGLGCGPRSRGRAPLTPAPIVGGRKPRGRPAAPRHRQVMRRRHSGLNVECTQGAASVGDGGRVCAGAAREPAMPLRCTRAGRAVRLTLGARRPPGGWRAGRPTRGACAAASWRTSRAPARPCRSSRSSGPTRRPRPSSACGRPRGPPRALTNALRNGHWAPTCLPFCACGLRARPARRLAARAAGSARVLTPAHGGMDAAGRRAGRGGGHAAV